MWHIMQYKSGLYRPIYIGLVYTVTTVYNRLIIQSILSECDPIYRGLILNTIIYRPIINQSIKLRAVEHVDREPVRLFTGCTFYWPTYI